MKYTNRIGKTYYLREGVTKTGKPRYFFSTQENGKGRVVDAIPNGYEIYEHPENAQVFLRKTGPQLITDIEEQLVKKHVGKLKGSRRYIVDRKDKYITIYESDHDTQYAGGNPDSLFGNILNQLGKNAGDDASLFAQITNRRYSGVMRFRLVSKQQRTFSAERYCFRGAIDGWIYLQGPDKLSNLIGKYVKLLGTDEFFELPF
jgi:hypothetical protein